MTLLQRVQSNIQISLRERRWQREFDRTGIKTITSADIVKRKYEEHHKDSFAEMAVWVVAFMLAVASTAIILAEH